jgi:very-short-patch-repair endonuclease
MTEPRPKYGKMSSAERAFITVWRALAPDASEPEREWRFHPVRKWRFDWAWPDYKVAVECEGGVWMRGRHTRGQGFTDDCWKYSTAAAMGWLVLRCTPGMLREDGAGFVELVKQALEAAIELP